MQIGQISFLVFLSKLLGAALGFIATLVFARVLGAEVLGIFTLILMVVSWLAMAGELGISGATTKRVSEAEDPGAYFTASIIWLTVFGAVASLLLIVGRSLIETYISGYDEYIAISVVWILIGLLFLKIAYNLPQNVLKGERKVHVSAFLGPLKEAVQGIIQITLVLAGYSLLGMIVGWAVGGIVVLLIGLYFISTKPAIPDVRHFKSLFDYAKYSWLGKLKSRIFNDIDVLILGVFASSATVGIYAVAWSLSKFLQLFSSAISSTLFPEISYTSTQDSINAVTRMVEDSITYTGLMVIPGLIGGFILAEELMLVYGTEFIDGATVLWLLILAILIHSFQKQFVNALNGLDYPNLSFRINLIFAALNAGLNLVLIPPYGINGAAIASVLSVTIALFLSYYYLNQLLTFSLPIGEVLRQFTAAGVMGLIILGAREILYLTPLADQIILLTGMLVVLGAAIYFILMLVFSQAFRETVERNLPFRFT